jgi:hypothetical protein
MPQADSISQADHDLHEAIEHDGYESKQAEHARHEVQKVREACWSSRHKSWDPDEKNWRTNRDWDDDDRGDYRRQEHNP